MDFPSERDPDLELKLNAVKKDLGIRWPEFRDEMIKRLDDIAPNVDATEAPECWRQICDWAYQAYEIRFFKWEMAESRARAGSPTHSQSDRTDPKQICNTLRRLLGGVRFQDVQLKAVDRAGSENNAADKEESK